MLKKVIELGHNATATVCSKRYLLIPSFFQVLIFLIPSFNVEKRYFGIRCWAMLLGPGILPISTILGRQNGNGGHSHSASLLMYLLYGFWFPALVSPLYLIFCKTYFTRYTEHFNLNNTFIVKIKNEEIMFN